MWQVQKNGGLNCITNRDNFNNWVKKNDLFSDNATKKGKLNTKKILDILHSLPSLKSAKTTPFKARSIKAKNRQKASLATIVNHSERITEKAISLSEKADLITLDVIVSHAFCCHYGIGVKIDKFTARKCWEYANKITDNRLVKHNLAVYNYFKVGGGKIDIESSKKAFKEIVYTDTQDIDSFNRDQAYESGCLLLVGKPDFIRDEERGFKLIEKAANENHKTALLILFSCLFNGIGCDINYQKAFEALILSSKLQCHRAQYVLSFFNYFGFFDKKSGYSLPSNHNNAFIWCLSAARYDACAKNAVGCFLSGGYSFIKTDRATALQYFKESMKEGCSGAFYSMGKIYETDKFGFGKNLPLAISTFEEGAKIGSRLCIFKLVYWFTKMGGRKNLDKAVELCKKYEAIFDINYLFASIYMAKEDFLNAFLYYKKATNEKTYQDICQNRVESGFRVFCLSESFLRLANFYEEGIIVKKDKKRAFEFYKKAAGLGSAEAQNCLAQCYSNYRVIAKKDFCLSDYVNRQYQDNPYVKTDYEKAFHYYKILFKKNYPKSEFHLGILYFRGMGVKQDFHIAKKYFMKSVEEGNICCLHFITEIDDVFIKEKKDPKQAKNELQQSVDYLHKFINKKGGEIAPYLIGKLYFMNRGIFEKAPFFAFVSFKLGASKNEINSQYHLGICFLEGIGTSKNTDEGLKYISKAVEGGNATAKLYFDKIKETYEHSV